MRTSTIAWLALVSTALCVEGHYSCGDSWDKAACSPKYGGCSTCGNRINWLMKNKNYDSHNARKTVAKEFPKECGPCSPYAPQPPPSPPSPPVTSPPTPPTVPPTPSTPPTPGTPGVPPTGVPPTPGTPGVPPTPSTPPTPGTPGVPPTGVPPTPGTPPSGPPEGCFGTWVGSFGSVCIADIPEQMRGPFGTWESGFSNILEPAAAVDGGVAEGSMLIWPAAEGAEAGWTNQGSEVMPEGVSKTSLLLWGNVEGCSVDGATPAGSADVEVNADGVSLMLDIGAGLRLHKASVWLGSDLLPQPWAGRFTSDPARFPYETESEGEHNFSLRNHDPTQPLYFALYAEVCPEPEGTRPF